MRTMTKRNPIDCDIDDCDEDDPTEDNSQMKYDKVRQY